ncbi:MAG: PQQ-dependent sugar dehydrogenase [Opitutus sp.]
MRIACLAFLLLVPLLHGTTGPELYQQHCAVCHGPDGRGVAGAIPPLASSDFITRQRLKALQAPLGGLSGAIEVNGTHYDGIMPPLALPDEEVAAILGYVFSSWGNQETAPTVKEITEARRGTRFKTLAALKASYRGTALPPAPPGWTLSVGAELSFSPVKLAAHPDGQHVLALAEGGDVWSWTVGKPDVSLLYPAASYQNPALGFPNVVGMTVDREGRLYMVCNQRDETLRPVMNHVTIFRTAPWSAEHGWGKPAPWFQTDYPWGIGSYNHGASHAAIGPDGWLYVNSGSRTDGGEAGKRSAYAKLGETPITACMWRLNPAEEKPVLQIYARGLRNSFGFCWDEAGHLLATENGPDADAPEELNWIEADHHYGFPFQFSDWTRKPYRHTPDAPPGLVITPPFRNLGPDAGGKPGGLATFQPHCSPAGITWLGTNWPAPLGGSFIVARFGNFLGGEGGFDLVQLRPDFSNRTTSAHSLVRPLGRPIDLLKLSEHRLVIAEYCGGTNPSQSFQTPGRLLVLTPAPSDAAAR